MCRHEICLLQKYVPHYFDIQHHHRDSVTKSFNCGEQIEYNDVSSNTIVDDIVRSIQDSEKDCPLDQKDIEDDETLDPLTIQ